jgi:hypothetical protein
MNSFRQSLLRLKLQLNVETDQEVAAVLGFTANNFTNRKSRGYFPVDRLRAVAQQRPDLGLDVDYVLGTRADELLAPEAKGRAEMAHRRANGAANTEAAEPFNFPTFDEMAAYMDAEMQRLGVGPFAQQQQLGAAA